MRCEYIIQQNIERRNNRFAIEVRVHCHQGDLRKHAGYSKVKKVKFNICQTHFFSKLFNKVFLHSEQKTDVFLSFIAQFGNESCVFLHYKKKKKCSYQ